MTDADEGVGEKGLQVCQTPGCGKEMQGTARAWVTFTEAGDLVRLVGFDLSEGESFYCEDDHPATAEQVREFCRILDRTPAGETWI